MNEAISPIGSNIKPPIRTNLQYLPTEELPWEDFEQLCLNLVQTEFSIWDSERLGKTGQNQQGIDIFARHKDGRYSVYQCKKYNYFTKKDLTSAISKFREGKYFLKSERFFICTACPLNSNQIQDAFEEQKALLKNDGIDLIKWDKIQLSRILKEHPKIVLDIFGSEFVKAFNGLEALSTTFYISDSEINSQFRTASGELYNIDNNFPNLPGSHIVRKETEELYNWILKELIEEESNIAVLAGSAGTGKTVILKDLIDILGKDDIPVLGLKADKKILNAINPEKSVLNSDADILSMFEQLLSKHENVVLLVDQIDALSQSLSANREQIRAYTSLIDKISSNEKIRVIISCRIFDLNHDMELRQYLNKKIIKVSLLSEKEVEDVLFQLTKKSAKYPKDFIDLLKTPLHLDVFCRIFSDSLSINEIRNLQDLYNALWNLKIKEVRQKVDIAPEILESVLYNIANEINERQENLSVPVLLFNNFYEPLKYLKSENLIIENNSGLQFFHQSFYDYTYARNFVEKESGNIFEFLINQAHQGLFIRSVTKQVLAYLKLYNYKEYIEQLKSIIFSDKIRYHIKLLIIELLSFEENPKTGEFQLITSIIPYNHFLAQSFFHSIPGITWFTFFIRREEILLDLINNGDDQIRDTVTRFIVFSGDNDIENAIHLLNKIKDENSRGNLICWILYRTKEFSLPIVTNAYFSIEKDFIRNDRERLHILCNAIKSNPDFAIDEAKKIFLSNLPDWVKKRKRELGFHSEESEFVDFCENLYKEAPIKAYSFLKEIVLCLIDKTIFDHPYLEYNVLREDSAFQEYNPDMYEYHKYLNWIIDYLHKNENNVFVRNELAEYLSSKQSTQIFIALQVLNHNPQAFLSDIFSLLVNIKLVEDILLIEDLKYWYRALIKNSYLLFSDTKRKKLNQFILTYFTKKDFDPDREYKNQRTKYGAYKNKFYPLPFWGYDQWLLLNSIPAEEIDINSSLKVSMLMWSRRFKGWSYKNIKPNHSVTMAGTSGGLVSKDRYELFTLNQWTRSFSKYDIEEHHYYNRRFFSVDEHANAFRDIVKKDPKKYFTFISELIFKNDANIRYQISGLEGLVEGEFDVKEIRALYSLLMNRDINEIYRYTFLDLSKYFLKNSVIDQELIEFWEKYIESPFENKDSGYILDSRDKNESNDKLFSEGWRTINARAIKLLVRLSGLKSYTEYVLNYLLSICDSLPIQLRLVVLHSVDNGCGFNSDQLKNIFIRYTKEVSSEVYTVSSALLNHLFFCCFNDILPFIQQTIFLPSSAKSLGIYLLYGWFYGNEKSKELLFELHETHPASIGESINQAFRYLHDEKYKEKCLYVLNHYVNDQRSDIKDSYSSGFHHLTPHNLLSVKNIIKQFIASSNEERLYSLYSFLFDCSKDYPNECIEFLHDIDFKRIAQRRHDVEDPIKLLMLSYNSIRKYDSLDENLDFAMDVFDELLQQINSKPEIDKILKELDYD
ncbi:AAA family ATPase [Sunxiuqinia dokdonensis]|uniref:AAA+ ATPase domain-containing protein n=1 Tax=Sunxiuqinia dokdonensis TaxID=1409788 RepID=A0A0L8V8T0_9BACT|nr:AAA family ATPase [Sunxiuqinia dokdonensis]KOH44851.1 hypothetical protein NC99_22830 [Sunxiuqinia dokdonensis]